MSLAFGQDSNQNLIPLLLDASGKVLISGLPMAAVLDDGTVNPTAPFIATAPHAFNGVTWDRWRNNLAQVLRPRAIYTTSYNVQQCNHNAKGVILYLDITAVPGVQTLTVTIYDVLPDGVNVAAILLSAALSTVGIRTYVVYPEVITTGIYTQTVQSPLTRDWYLQVAHSGSGNWTYMLGTHLLV